VSLFALLSALKHWRVIDVEVVRSLEKRVFFMMRSTPYKYCFKFERITPKTYGPPMLLHVQFTLGSSSKVHVTTAQILGPGPIFSAEFVLSIPPSPRICAATQPEKP